MKPRKAESTLLKMAGYYPVVTVTGPRQSGKTTLCKGLFPDKAYVTLEALDSREYADRDPRGFLSEYSSGAIIDEVQQVPSLLSYLQEEVDANAECGRFILTGSQNFTLAQHLSQSLAGRSGILHLLPLSLDELGAFPSSSDELFEVVWSGGYPRIHDRQIPPQRWLADYVANYLQRDVRQILNVADLQRFTSFLKLCAGRTAQELNLSSLGGDAGVSNNTARSWLSVLEASFICTQLPAWHRNFRKQVVKAPKLHFLDTGLVCYLLGIRDPEQLRHHPLRGAVFETWVVSEIHKGRAHRGLPPDLYHFRETRGLEIDLVQEDGAGITLTEIKSGETIHQDFFTALNKMETRLSGQDSEVSITKQVIYGGKSRTSRNQNQVIPWSEVQRAKK